MSPPSPQTAGAPLPFGAVAAAAGALVLVEVALMPGPPGAARGAAAGALVAAALLVLRWSAPAGLAAVVGGVWLARSGPLDGDPAFGLSLAVPVAAFAAAAALRARWSPLLLAGGVAHVLAVASHPRPDDLVLVVAGALYVSGWAAGALLRHVHTVVEQRSEERAALVQALARGPREAVAAEQLRVWWLVQARLADTIALLPPQVRALQTLSRGPEEAARRLESVRLAAADALEQMRATLRAFDGDETIGVWAAAPPSVRARRRRDVPVGALVLGCAALAAGAALEQALLDLSGPAALGFPLALVLPFTALLAPRRPVAACALLGAGVAVGSAAGVVGGPTITHNFAGMLVVGTVAATAHGPRRLLALAVAQAGMLGGLWAEAAPWAWPGYLGLALGMAGSFCGGLLLRDAVREHREVAGEARRLASELDDLERQVAIAERFRLARELHDIVGHGLTVVCLQAGAAAAQVRSRGPHVRESLQALQTAADLAAEELSRFGAIVASRSSTTADLEAELQSIVGAARGAGVNAELDRVDAPPHLGADVREELTRIAREALTNAAKHARGAPVRVAVEPAERPAWIRLSVVNGEGGASGLPGGGVGLASMAERADRCGGTLESGPLASGGWHVTAELPDRRVRDRRKAGRV
jgi:signal transduction histidine kinase